MKLHALPLSFRTTPIHMAFELAGLEYTTNNVDFAQIKDESFLKLNPNGKSPVLEVPEGPIFELNAILRHIARTAGKLYGSNNYETALVDQWLSWVNSEVAPILPGFLPQHFGFPFAQLNWQISEISKSKNYFLQKLAALNTHLEGRKYVVGETVTIADIAILNLIYHSIVLVFGDKERKAIPNVIAWIENFAQEQATFKKWYGRVRFASQGLKVPKVEFPKAEPKKKEPAPKKEKEEADIAEEPKVVVPTFPDTQFNLDIFKTEFINEPDHAKALENFWNQFKEGEYSLYHLKYLKYPGECEIVYRTNNLLRGFLSRIEHIRKFLFGTHIIMGDEPVLEIQGVWLVRGPELFQLIKELDQYDTYEWIKLDSSTDETKALVKEFWTNREEDVDKVSGHTIRTFKWIK